MFEFQEEADDLLEEIIPHLNNFSHISGGEGTVYFIDDNFVVKRFFKDIMESQQNQQTLVKHSAEVNRLSMQGWSIPRIYAISLPNGERKSAYLLEERAKGTSIFPTEHFEKLMMIYRRKRDAKLQRELISIFKSCYLTVNEQLEALPDSELEKFIMTDFYMTRDFKYGTPDVVSTNVLFDGNTLTHIDSYFAKEESSFTSKNGEALASNTPAESVLKDMVDLMYHNGYVQKEMMKAFGLDLEMRKQVKKNRAIVRENVKRVVKISNSLISPTFEGAYRHMMYNGLTNKLMETLNSKDISDITSLIERV